jgi:hypothetical protein
MLTLCCVCHEVLKDGPEDINHASHGYCDKCMRSEMAENGCTEEEINQVVKELNLRKWEKIWRL